MKLLLPLFSLFFLITISIAHAQIPQTFSYQGILSDAEGQIVPDNDYAITFKLYDTLTSGVSLWEEIQAVSVVQGLISVILGKENSIDLPFNKQYYLGITIGTGSELEPRTELTSVAYSFNTGNIADNSITTSKIVDGAVTSSKISPEVTLPPGGDAGGDLSGSYPDPLVTKLQGQNVSNTTPTNGQVLSWDGSQWNPSSGMEAEADRSAVHSGSAWDLDPMDGSVVSGVNTGIQEPASDRSFFGVYGESRSPVSTYPRSAGVYGHHTGGGTGVMGVAGDVSENWLPVGSVGIVGIGASRGVYGSSNTSYGSYSTSLNWYGIYGRTSRSDNNYGVYTPDNLYSSNINIAGAIMNVVRNGGNTSIETGDVVVFNGIDGAIEGTPIVQVAQATETNSHAVAGVVHSRFNIEVVADTENDPTPGMQITPAGPVGPGEYLLLVVHGPARVKANVVGGTVQPGDLLSTSDIAGAAAKAETIKLNGVLTSIPGTILGKALEPLTASQDFIYIFVTLN